MRRLLIITLLAVSCATANQPKRVDVRLVTDEADAVLNILAKREANQSILDSYWQQLFTSEGFIRLKKRENSLQRPFDEEIIRKFVLSDELLANRSMLARVLNDWKRADLSGAARRALAYLPGSATIHAKIYPVIKPAKNSFVFELETDPAIFKYIEDEPKEEFERTMSHEMHHVGYGTACRGEVEPHWISAFGEGFAVLAAAGGPDRPPQGRWSKEWNEEMGKFGTNFRDVETFLLDVTEGRVSGDEERKRGFGFFGMLGPWYTIGWKMGVVIEKTRGRQALIDAMCDQRTLLQTYNHAADLWEQKTGEKLPHWSDQLLKAIR